MVKRVQTKVRKLDFFWIFYQVILVLFFFIFWPFFIQKIKKGLKQRLGFLNESTNRGGEEKLIWAHAASVGEVVAMGNLIRALKEECPDYNFVISTLTGTGQATARRIVPDARAFIYFPLDFSCVVGRVLDTIAPKLFIITETELWPNFIREAKKRTIPIIVTNGRISANSFRKYRMVKFLMRRVLKNIDAFIMQSQIDAQRIVSLGADPSAVTVTGNLKFDVGTNILLDSVEANLPHDKLIFVAGSTHRGEEETIVDVYGEIRKSYPHLVLILAPRHLERVGEVEKLLNSKNLQFTRRSRLSSPFQGDNLNQIVLLDTIGELTRFYALARIVFVGGSLVPVGGHNILEPASLGKGVLFGPYMDNFEEIARSFVFRGAGRVVSNKRELLDSILELLSNPEELKRMGKTALEIIKANKGSAEKSAKLVKNLLIHN
ncbi:MAG: 3-deoxy-D-manno-octulosonic acid transferase [Elusimicrobiota bacterium]|nr:3-deoxy-D-manno-octulosonic acid transferase [Elusimicrobiota bacterium]